MSIGDEEGQPFQPPPLFPSRVHWPARFGREELMVETLPGIERGVAEHLVRALLAQSGVAGQVRRKAETLAHEASGRWDRVPVRDHSVACSNPLRCPEVDSP